MRTARHLFLMTFLGCVFLSAVQAQRFTTLLSFDNTIGSAPMGTLVEGPDGNFYGTMSAGGVPNYGTIYKVTPGGAPTKIHEFVGAEGCFPMAGMILAPDGNFYGTTHGKCTLVPAGSVFKMTPGGVVNAIRIFDAATILTGPVTKLLAASDGYLYGTTEGKTPQGVGSHGTIFKVLPSGGSYTTVFSFTSTPAYGNSSELIQGPDGNLYSTFGGGYPPFNQPIGGGGLVLTPGGKVTIFSLTAPTHGYGPVGGMALGPDGNFYATCALSLQPTAGQGTVFRMTPSGTLSEIHAFSGAEGNAPMTTLLPASDGNFYGTTSSGGLNGGGTLFRMTPSGTVTVLQNFGGASGTNPQGLIQASDGALYGVTTGGGANGAGTFFKLSVVPPPPSELDFTHALRVAQIADGASWKTSFQVISLDTIPLSYAMRSWDDNGISLQLPLANGALSGILPAGGVAFLESQGTANDLSQGWAEIAASGPIAVLTIFKQSVPGRPDSEGTVIAAQSGSRILLPFDNTRGYTTGVAVANTNQTQTLDISLQFQLENGLQGSGSMTLGPRAHTAFVVPSNFPVLAGVRGTITFTTPSADLSVLGLRFSPTTSFTSLGQFQ